MREFGNANDKVLVDNTPSDDAIQDSSDEEATLREEPEEQPQNNMPGPSFVLDDQQRPQEPEANMDEFDCP